jgi:hypothetical protein
VKRRRPRNRRHDDLVAALQRPVVTKQGCDADEVADEPEFIMTA